MNLVFVAASSYFQSFYAGHRYFVPALVLWQRWNNIGLVCFFRSLWNNLHRITEGKLGERPLYFGSWIICGRVWQRWCVGFCIVLKAVAGMDTGGGSFSTAGSLLRYTAASGYVGILLLILRYIYTGSTE